MLQASSGGADGSTTIFLEQLEKRYEYIGGSVAGSKRAMKKYKALFQKIYLYYGITQKDIDEHTKRYDDVVRTLEALR